MKIALVCIAKNEDEYIQEWVNYNKKLGFDDIFIYQNDWECQVNEDNVFKITFNGVNQQINAYNHFIQKYHKHYDWAAFFDVDEFLVLKKHNNVKNFISDYKEFNAVGINWYLFGNNNHNEVNGDYSVVNRFTKRQFDVNMHVKCFVKLSPQIKMLVHNPTCSWVDTNKISHSGPFNQSGDDSIAILNHYYCKTKDEFIKKCERGRADSLIKRTINEYEHANLNDVEDLSAYNFYNNL